MRRGILHTGGPLNKAGERTHAIPADTTAVIAPMSSAVVNSSTTIAAPVNSVLIISEGPAVAPGYILGNPIIIDEGPAAPIKIEVFNPTEGPITISSGSTVGILVSIPAYDVTAVQKEEDL